MAEGKTDEKKADDARPWLRRLRMAMMILGPAILLAVVLWYYLAHSGYVSTDDAFVQANTVTISSQMPGACSRSPCMRTSRWLKVRCCSRSMPRRMRRPTSRRRRNSPRRRISVQALKAQYKALEAQIAGAAAQAAYLTAKSSVKGHSRRKASSPIPSSTP